MTDPTPGVGGAGWSRPALASSGGFLVALAMPPWGLWPLAFVGIAVFELALGSEPSRRRRGWCGLAFGVPWMFMGMGWMWFLTVPGYLIACSLFAGLHALAALIAPTGAWRIVGRPAAHGLVEAVRLAFPFGGVPLATLGISQADGPLLDVARVGGVILLTWIVFQIGFAIGGLASTAARPTGVGSAGVGSAGVGSAGVGSTRMIPLVTIAAVVAVVGLAAIAPSGQDLDGAQLTVAAVQGGGEQGTSALDVPASLVFERHLAATAEIEPDPDLDLVVWPENGIDVNRQPFAGSEEQARVAGEAARLDVPFSVGVTLDSEFSEQPAPDGFVNAQVVVTPNGEVTSAYEKVRIVPFGEYVPLRGLLEALGAPLERVASDAVRGQPGPAVIELPDGTPLGVLISWEVFFGDRGRAAADGALLLNPTNGASYTGTVLQTQQIAASRLRATETGRWVVQVSPTGFSAFVSPDGEVDQRTGVSERAVIVSEVPLRDGTTWYVRTGDWPWTAAIALTLVGAWWFGAARRRQSTGSNQRSPSSST